MTHPAQTIDDLLSDPLIQKVMRADRVEPASLKALFVDVSARVAGERRQQMLAYNPESVRFAGERPRPAPSLLRLAPPAPRNGCFGRFC